MIVDADEVDEDEVSEMTNPTYVERTNSNIPMPSHKLQKTEYFSSDDEEEESPVKA